MGKGLAVDFSSRIRTWLVVLTDYGSAMSPAGGYSPLRKEKHTQSRLYCQQNYCYRIVTDIEPQQRFLAASRYVKGPRMMRGPLIHVFPVSREMPATGAAGRMLQNSMWDDHFFDAVHLSCFSISASCCSTTTSCFNYPVSATVSYTIDLNRRFFQSVFLFFVGV